MLAVGNLDDKAVVARVAGIGHIEEVAVRVDGQLAMRRLLQISDGQLGAGRVAVRHHERTAVFGRILQKINGAILFDDRREFLIGSFNIHISHIVHGALLIIAERAGVQRARAAALIEGGEAVGHHAGLIVTGNILGITVEIVLYELQLDFGAETVAIRAVQ